MNHFNFKCGKSQRREEILFHFENVYLMYKTFEKVPKRLFIIFFIPNILLFYFVCCFALKEKNEVSKVYLIECIQILRAL